MAVWLVRAGKYGEREDLALEQGLAVAGWEDLPDLSGVKSKEELHELVRNNYPDENPKKLAQWTGQLWTLRERMKPGDLVALPLKTRAAIAIGEINGPYEYRTDLPEDVHHVRPVKWIEKDIPRSKFDQDLLFSLGSSLTVCQIERNQAEGRIRAMLEGKAPPAAGTAGSAAGTETMEPAVPTDLEEYGRDQIRTFVGQKFKGHALTGLVTELLRAQGYQTWTSPAGADGGVDVIAGRGPMGFDPPRLCVQVKSGDSPVDVKVLRELQGVMSNFSAEQGLLVSWGGFRDSVYKEARQLFFKIRLWDTDKLVDALLEHYDRLPEQLQAELPLKRIWALALEE